MLTKYLIVFFVSMVPLVELRGAIPIAEAMNLPLVQYYIIAILGNMLPVPIIYFFARKVLIWGADKPVIGKFFSFCLEKGERGGKKLQEKAGRGLFVALMIFVGIPLPGTGLDRYSGGQYPGYGFQVQRYRRYAGCGPCRDHYGYCQRRRFWSAAGIAVDR